jgi:hypothetical protein
LFECYRVVKHRDKWGIAVCLWFIGFIMVYAVQLPVTYQHARYVMPAIPAYLLAGFSGYIHLMNLLKSKLNRGNIRWILSKSWLLLLITIPTVFSIQGAFAYAEDVAIIETEMVNTAKWIAKNTSPDAIIAGHDIGALGYFGNREILDLAGLIDPEIVPIIRNEKELGLLLLEREVDFLVAFPGWYPSLVLMGDMAYETGGIFSPKAGGENMVIYRLP